MQNIVSVSDQDSEMQSMSYDAQTDDTMSPTDDTMSLTDGSNVDYPSHSRSKRKRRRKVKVRKHLSNPVYNAKDQLNPEISTIPRTKCLPDTKPLTQEQFHAALVNKLNKVVEEREMMEKVNEMLKVIEGSELSWPDDVSYLPAPSYSSACQHHKANQNRFFAPAFITDLPEENVQDILDQHISSAFDCRQETSAGVLSPTAPRPSNDLENSPVPVQCSSSNGLSEYLSRHGIKYRKDHNTYSVDSAVYPSDDNLPIDYRRQYKDSSKRCRNRKFSSVAADSGSSCFDSSISETVPSYSNSSRKTDGHYSCRGGSQDAVYSQWSGAQCSHDISVSDTTFNLVETRRLEDENRAKQRMNYFRFSLTVLTFVSAVSAYLFCLFLIIAANITIRMAINLILLVVWLDQMFYSNSEGIHGFARKQSSSVSYRNQKLKIMEKEINNVFTNIFLLWIPPNFKCYEFFYFLLHLHRRIFRIPASFHSAIFFRLFYCNFTDEPSKSINRCGSAGDNRPKKYSRCNFRHLFIYWFILSFHHTCTAVIQVLLLAVTASSNVYLWILTQKEPSEVKSPLSNLEHTELENLACAELVKTKYIVQTMKRKFPPILLVWSPTDIAAPDAIDTVLFNIEREVEIRVKWNRVPSMTDSSAIFGGIMATFPSFENMSKAVQTLTVFFKYLKCIDAKKLLSFIMQSEASHLECGFKNCEVIISGRCGINKEEERQSFKEVLSEFGIIQKITFNENFQNSGRDVFCTVEYAFVTHAYFFKLCMDGTFLSTPFKGRIFIGIKESTYVNEIMRKVKGKLIQSLEQNHLCDF